MPRPTPGATNVIHGPPLQTNTIPFTLAAGKAVYFKLFNVLTPGPIQINIAWPGNSQTLTAELSGRRRPELPVPTTPYASASGVSPLSLSYTVTPADLNRGVGWRLAIKDPMGVGAANGTITLAIPFETNLNVRVQRDKVSMRS